MIVFYLKADAFHVVPFQFDLVLKFLYFYITYDCNSEVIINTHVRQVQSALCSAVEASTSALRLDRALYTALRRELRNVEQFLHFAHQLKNYVLDEGDAVRTRIVSAICFSYTHMFVQIRPH